MDGDLTLGIDRDRTEWDDLVYECRECGVVGQAVAALEHDTSCYVGSPVESTPLGWSGDPTVMWRSEFADSTVDVFRELVQKASWHQTETDDDTDALVEKLNDVEGVKWATRGSAHRAVVGLGRTSPRGDFHLPNRRGVVVKLDPRIRFDEEYTPVSSNLDELFTWEKAVETDTTMFFAELLAGAPDGMWLAMEYCIPISLRVRSEMQSRDMLHDSRGEEYIYPLVAALKQAGWEDPDHKHGNIGLSDNGRSVLIDYATGPDYTESNPSSEV